MSHARISTPVAVGAIAALGVATGAGASDRGPDNFQMTILHHNDAESQLINAGSGLEDFGGIARFGTLLNSLRDADEANGRAVVALTSGDNFLAGPEFNASLENGVPFFDTVGLDLIGYDAFCIGNHEFDFGPDVLADFIVGFSLNPAPFLSANLDVSPEPALQALADDGRIAASTVVEKNGEQIGVVGATTPNLPFISSPGDVIVNSDVAGAVQTEVDALLADGVNKIIVISHLQSVQEDVDLISSLSNVDIVIAGGGDDLLANEGTLLVPGDVIEGPYPLTATDADDNTVYVVTTAGDYRYVGRLLVEFDAAGNVVNVDTDNSGPVRVAGGDEPDAVEPDPDIQAQVVDPVVAFVENLANTIIGTSEVPLNGVRDDVRSKETNLGNLITDGFRWQVAQAAAAMGMPEPDVALQNGGGIRNDSILPAGDLSVLDTFDILPFTNFLAIFPQMPAAELLDVMENAVSRVDPPPGFPTGGTGRFSQVSGIDVVYDVDRDPGIRIRSIHLEDGTPLVLNGMPVDGAPLISLATNSFSAQGGDEYPFVSPFELIGVTYQQSLRNYIEVGLGGLITGEAYPAGGERRIVRLDTDIDGDGTVGVDDLMALLGAWGPCEDCPEDVNKDGIVDVTDLLEVLASWD